MLEPKVGVIIVTFNSEKYISQCLLSLQKNSYPKSQIVVADNNSNDKTDEIIEKKFPNVILIKSSKNVGFAAGNNKGLKYLYKNGFDYFLLINPDTVVNKNLISKLIKIFRINQRIGIVGSVITYFNKRDKIWFGGGVLNTVWCYTRHKLMNTNLKDQNLKQSETDYITGCCCMIKRELLTRVGLLRTDYGSYFEDVDYCYRAKRAGFFIILCPESLVLHKVSSSFGIEGKNILTPTRAYFFARNPFIFIKKELKKGERLTPILGQFIIRFPYYLFDMIRNRSWNAIPNYILGLKDGINLLLG